MALMEQNQLIHRLKNGNEAAFEEVLRAHSGALFSFLCHLSSDRELAKELLQDTWIKLAEHAPSFDEKMSVRPWLFTVARNAYWSHRRWSRLDLARMAEVALMKIDSTAHSPHEHAEINQTQIRIQRALAQLSPVYREALLLVSVHEFEPTQAAEVLNIKPEAFRQRLSRARDALRKLLGETI